MVITGAIVFKSIIFKKWCMEKEHRTTGLTCTGKKKTAWNHQSTPIHTIFYKRNLESWKKKNHPIMKKLTTQSYKATHIFSFLAYDRPSLTNRHVWIVDTLKNRNCTAPRSENKINWYLPFPITWTSLLTYLHNGIIWWKKMLINWKKKKDEN